MLSHGDAGNNSIHGRQRTATGGGCVRGRRRFRTSTTSSMPLGCGRILLEALPVAKTLPEDCVRRRQKQRAIRRLAQSSTRALSPLQQSARASPFEWRQGSTT